MSEPTYVKLLRRQRENQTPNGSGYIEVNAIAFDALLSELDRRGQEIERLERERPFPADWCAISKAELDRLRAEVEVKERSRLAHALELEQRTSEVARLQGELARKVEECHEHSERAGHFMREMDTARAERDRAQTAAEHMSDEFERWSAYAADKDVALDRAERAERALAAANANLEAYEKILRLLPKGSHIYSGTHSKETCISCAREALLSADTEAPEPERAVHSSECVDREDGGIDCV